MPAKSHSFSLPPIPVSLFGFGTWAKKRFFPILKALHEWGIIFLTVIDVFDRPEDLASTIDYMRWDIWAQRKKECRVAFVVCSTKAHFKVCRELLEIPSLRVVVCEKSFCEKREAAMEIQNVASALGVSVIICDHYLLRKEAAAVNAEIINSLGKIIKVTGRLNERTAEGPHIGVGVILDLIPHLLDWIHVLFPGGSFETEESVISLSKDGNYSIYAWTKGYYHWANNEIFLVELESGKEMPEDEKYLEIIGYSGEIKIDFKEHLLMFKNQEGVKTIQWDGNWNYSHLILQALLR